MALIVQHRPRPAAGRRTPLRLVGTTASRSLAITAFAPGIAVAVRGCSRCSRPLEQARACTCFWCARSRSASAQCQEKAVIGATGKPSSASRSAGASTSGSGSEPHRSMASHHAPAAPV